MFEINCKEQQWSDRGNDKSAYRQQTSMMNARLF